MLFKVRNKATGKEELIRPSKYAAYGPQVYQKLGTVEDDGTEVLTESTPNQKPQAQERKGGAAPVEVEAPKLDPNPLLNIQSTQVSAPEPEQKTEPKKRGRQFGSKNKAKSISSSNEDAQ